MESEWRKLRFGHMQVVRKECSKRLHLQRKVKRLICCRVVKLIATKSYGIRSTIYPSYLPPRASNLYSSNLVRFSYIGSFLQDPRSIYLARSHLDLLPVGRVPRYPRACI